MAKDNANDVPETLSSAELLARRNALEAKLGKHVPDEKTVAEEQDKASNKSGLALALRLSSEFVAGIAVGAGFGYAIDTFFGTAPWGMISFLLLGFAAAILNIMRATGKVAESPLHLHKAHGSEPDKMPDE